MFFTIQIQVAVFVLALNTWHNQDSFQTVSALIITTATFQLLMTAFCALQMDVQHVQGVLIVILAKFLHQIELVAYVPVLGACTTMESMRNAKVYSLFFIF